MCDIDTQLKLRLDRPSMFTSTEVAMAKEVESLTRKERNEKS